MLEPHRSVFAGQMAFMTPYQQCEGLLQAT